eukprot:gb/GECH01012308.1/.p1 GENE.gb/GECH01012308.1/~~gb/GECH01012308.1/.p1  ORF type:complete len:155 (+),score=36.15 gb/GECH01012308.1/:1-465(+)
MANSKSDSTQSLSSTTNSQNYSQEEVKQLLLNQRNQLMNFMEQVYTEKKQIKKEKEWCSQILEENSTLRLKLENMEFQLQRLKEENTKLKSPTTNNSSMDNPFNIQQNTQSTEEGNTVATQHRRNLLSFVRSRRMHSKFKDENNNNNDNKNKNN